MNKERKVNGLSEVVVFDRDVKASELNALFEDFNGDIIINGELYVEEYLCIKCDNLYVENIRVEISVLCLAIDINGNLFVKGGIWCNDIKINGSIYVEGMIHSLDLIVAEDAYIGGIYANYSEVAIGGNIVCFGADAIDELTVLGSTEVDTTITANYINLKGPVQALGIYKLD